MFFIVIFFYSKEEGQMSSKTLSLGITNFSKDITFLSIINTDRNIFSFFDISLFISFTLLFNIYWYEKSLFVLKIINDKLFK